MATDIHSGSAPGTDVVLMQGGSVLEVRPEAQAIGIVKAARAVSGGTGYTLARGEATLDGSNPTSVTIVGLGAIAAAHVSLKSASAPGDDPSWLSVDYGAAVPAGQLDIYAWKNTGGTDPTLVASTNASAVVSWIAIGDPA